MTINDAKRLLATENGGLYEEDDNAFIILPCRIWDHRPNQRNYVVLDLKNSPDTADPIWYDIFLEKVESITYQEIKRKYARKNWHTLVHKCKDSERWEVWTLEELKAYNSHDLINDPGVERGFIVQIPVVGGTHDVTTS